MIPGYFWLVPLSAICVLWVAVRFFRVMKAEPAGTKRMIEIANYVRDGAMAYLKQQYKIVTLIFVLIAILLGVLAYKFHLQSKWIPFAFWTAGLGSGLAGFIGMKTATEASSRAAFAASKSLNHGLRVAFRSGAVMGLSVVGLALLDYSFWFLVLNIFDDAVMPHNDRMIVITSTMLTFAIGASLQALFARVGGGIFTKAADVGADLVGKVERDIPEDDPRNPATIADNVGDNVGDVAGMGADLYESYYGAILAAAALGASAFARGTSELQMKAILLPVLIGAVGAILSIVGIFVVKTEEGASSQKLLRSLGNGVRVSGLCILIASWGILYMLNIPNAFGIWGALAVGLIAGEVIGKASEYYTSQAYYPTRHVAGQAQTGPATVIIGGIGVGMVSTAIPVL
ncbi:MAG: sodium/proton-translocating pyrophosphatase, partial [Puniceicoccales bacterium]|nr:sodium/proton-translocating pyrophosphatase [Puniceicoccales bacterium]